MFCPDGDLTRGFWLIRSEGNKLVTLVRHGVKTKPTAGGPSGGSAGVSFLCTMPFVCPLAFNYKAGS